MKYIIHHEIIAYLNGPIGESESYGNCTEVDLSCYVTYVLVESWRTTTRRDANLKKSKSWRSPMVAFLTLKKVFKVEIFRLNLKNSSKIKKSSQKYKKNRPKYVRKTLLWAFICFSGRFGNSYGRAGDSFCIRETPG